MLDYKNVEELHKDLVNKKISVTELVKETLNSIKLHESKLNAYISINEEQSLNMAAKIDKKGVNPDNLWEGIPIAVKDNLNTKGILTTAASKILSNFKPIYDATVVQKLKEAGAIIIGKTNLDEFAMGSSSETSYYGAVHNPWDLERVPGGSSAGSAATVASRDVLVSLGSDTGGSIRQPAAFNGVVGVKPTYGRVSRWGLIAFGSSFDQIGSIATNVQDAASLLTLISGMDVKDATSSSKKVPDFRQKLTGNIEGLRIGVPKEFFGDGVDPKICSLIKDSLKVFKEQGALIEEVSLPNSIYGIQAYYVLAPAEASSNLQRFDGIRYGYRADNINNLEDLYVKTRTEGFGDEVKRRIMLGTYALSASSYEAFFIKAAKVRTLIINDYKELFKKYDIIVGPTTPSVAFKFGDKKDETSMYMNDMLTVTANIAGLPAMSVPAGLVDGLPVGLHIIGKPFDEVTLLNAGYTFEKINNFNLKPNID
ncbi:MAG: Asp-tRNA(Asn)/Glu-tRNA(Gln) amidotransferase subunit GatA [Firmicutes bacterium]|uniref:Glutamyl-tRNA(Gln) amidotransferase subunit A n=1 Tax=Candidatus Gallilactobacillus intestinavium TaxID=2840838 RepID=A0A9D9E4W6_9LACO|nr:Asp-tRNA(Asn)/Glu-tRNA(Gln) amidotransferase subunit GatA [Candidatus Gallilactobacillus intestinavium]